MKNNITHNGIIERITGNSILVRIVQSSACAGCKIASHCSSAESKEKIVEVSNFDGETYSVGEEVKVIASESVGTIAVFYGFVLPFFVLIAGVLTAYLLKASEAMCGIIGLCSLIPYYFILYLCRRHFKKVITFGISK